MTDFRTFVEKRFGIDLPVLIKLEYKTQNGEFDKERYSKALENFYSTIDDIGVPPFEDFLVIGVENLHELDEKHKNMLKELAKKVNEMEFKAFPKFIGKMAEGFQELQEKHPEFVKKQDQ